jgi:hypothetical protein
MTPREKLGAALLYGAFAVLFAWLIGVGVRLTPAPVWAAVLAGTLAGIGIFVACCAATMSR